MGKLLALLQETRHQYILVGDWNTPPSSFEETILGSKFAWQIVAPPQTLLSGAVLDYALVQKQLAECMAVQSEWAVPWRPHALVTLTFERA